MKPRFVDASGDYHPEAVTLVYLMYRRFFTGDKTFGGPPEVLARLAHAAVHGHAMALSAADAQELVRLFGDSP